MDTATQGPDCGGSHSWNDLCTSRALLGPDHIQVSDDLWNGWVRADAGDFEDAKRFFEQVCRSRTKIGAEHLQTAGPFALPQFLAAWDAQLTPSGCFDEPFPYEKPLSPPIIRR